MSGKHTPGPWRIYIQDISDKDQAKRELSDLVEGTPNFQPYLIYVTDDDWNLATAVTGCGEHSKANARLIAAAPDLLAATQTAWELLRYQPRRVPPETDTARKLLEAAIAKATGSDPP